MSTSRDGGIDPAIVRAGADARRVDLACAPVSLSGPNAGPAPARGPDARAVPPELPRIFSRSRPTLSSSTIRHPRAAALSPPALRADWIGGRHCPVRGDPCRPGHHVLRSARRRLGLRAHPTRRPSWANSSGSGRHSPADQYRWSTARPTMATASRPSVKPEFCNRLSLRLSVVGRADSFRRRLPRRLPAPRNVVRREPLKRAGLTQQ